MRDRLIELLEEANAKQSEYIRENDHMDFIPTLKELLGVCADHLLSEGVIVPPCKVGDAAYVLTHDSPTGIEKSRVKRMSLIELQDGTSLRIIVPCVYDDWGNAIWEFYPEDFGKKVFLTREQAEKALAEVANGT